MYVRKLYHDGLAAFKALDGFGLERVEGEFEFFRRRRRRRGGRARRRSNIAFRVRHVVQTGHEFLAQGQRRAVITLVPFLRKQRVSRWVLRRPPLRRSRKNFHEPLNAGSLAEKSFRNGNTYFWVKRSSHQERPSKVLGRRRCAGHTQSNFFFTE